MEETQGRTSGEATYGVAAAIGMLVGIYSYHAGHLPLVTTVLAIASASAVLISSAIAKSAE
jgi:hypothetical protein